MIPCRALILYSVLLRVIQNCQAVKTVYIYVDKPHEKDVPEVSELLEANVKNLDIYFIIADAAYEGYSLTWAHKADLKIFSHF